MEAGEVGPGVVEGAVERLADRAGDMAGDEDVVEGVDLETQRIEGVRDGGVEAGDGGGHNEVELDRLGQEMGCRTEWIAAIDPGGKPCPASLPRGPSSSTGRMPRRMRGVAEGITLSCRIGEPPET